MLGRARGPLYYPVLCLCYSEWGMLHTPVDHSWKDGQVSTQERGKKKEVFIVSYNLIPGPVSPPQPEQC